MKRLSSRKPLNSAVCSVKWEDFLAYYSVLLSSPCLKFWIILSFLSLMTKNRLVLRTCQKRKKENPSCLSFQKLFCRHLALCKCS